MSAVKQAIERQFATLVEAYREEVGYPPDEEAEEMLWWQAEHDVTVPFEDRSGSVSDETLRAFVAEMQDVLRAGVVKIVPPSTVPQEGTVIVRLTDEEEQA